LELCKYLRQGSGCGPEGHRVENVCETGLKEVSTLFKY
jgi:hypothetical protein